MYATADGAVIPWTPITDMQISSTSAIRLHSILRAVTGNIDVAGGETFGGFNASYISESEIALHEELAPTQKAKQLGFDKHPAYTYRAAEMLKEPTEKVWDSPTRTSSWAVRWPIRQKSFAPWLTKTPTLSKRFSCSVTMP